MSKKVIFNALQTSLSAGIGRYSYELAKCLYIKNPRSIVIVIRSQDRELFNFVKSDSLIIADNIKNSRDRNIYEQFKLPKIIKKKYKDAIIHYPDTMAPLLSRNKAIITVHDLAFKSLRGVFTWKTVLWKRIVTYLSIKKAEKVISITSFTKEEILKHYPRLDKEKISVIYNGFNDFSKETINEFNVRKDIRDLNNYLLTVSTISPRKNIDGLIKSFYEIKDKIDQNLVIVGDNGWMSDNIFELVKKLELENRIIFTGKINDDELKYLYKNARIFLYLSFYEGFGLPPLEAMSYGIPCIVSNSSSLPEVVGDSAIKVNPNNILEISNSIYTLLNIKNERNAFLGYERIKKFSWNKCALEVMEIYKEFWM